MHLTRPQDAAPAATPPDARANAFATLGLDATADRALVELSVRYHLARCAHSMPDGPQRRTRLSELERAWRLLTRPGHHEVPRPSSVPVAYRMLRVHPSADQELITIAYRHLLGQAAAAGDEATLLALECAYARIGTPAARAHHDTEAATPRSVPKPGTRTSLAATRMALARVQQAAARARTLRLALPRPRSTPLPATVNLTPPSGREAPQVAHPIGALRVLQAGREVMTLDLEERGTYTIGAGPGVAIRLPGAAREHARLTAGQGWVLFQQLADQAVSFVNGARAVRALLGPGDHLDIGPYRCQYVIARYEPHSWSA